MVSGALFASKPLEIIAGVANPFMHSVNGFSSLFLLHTCNDDARVNSTDISSILKKQAHVLSLHAGSKSASGNTMLSYDVTACNNPLALNDDYTIIKKGFLNIGIIKALPGNIDVVNHVQQLSLHLKQEKKCHLVVCLSQLGFKNKDIADDLMLANQTKYVDVIVGGHTTNYTHLPYIALNSENQEVILHSSSESNLGVVAFEFDAWGKKMSIRFSA